MLSLLACLLILAFSFQGSRGIWQPDEGYYTGTAVTMLARDSFFVPYLGEHEIFLDKPPMIYWGIIAGLKLFGHSEFAVRFFHALCFVLTSLSVGSLTYSMYKDKWPAFVIAHLCHHGCSVHCGEFCYAGYDLNSVDYPFGTVLLEKC